MRNYYQVLLLGFLFVYNTSTSQNNVLIAAPEAEFDLYRPDVQELTKIPLAPVKGSENYGENANKVLSCPTSNTLVGGYPAWTHYWGGWMVNINNISTNTINITCFEARFQGTSGYRIYTKTGTFVGFETTSAAWTLVGTAANVTSISTTTSSPIPITVNQTINPGTTRAFYLTRTDNLVANRHLYVAGVGTPGTTVYASDANIQITEANYIDVYFINMGGTRRPSFQVYYDIVAPLPIELKSFICTNKKIGMELKWATATEKNSSHFAIERSADGTIFDEIGRVNAEGNSSAEKQYQFMDNSPVNGVNYYRLKAVDVNGESKYSDISACTFEKIKARMNVYSYTGVLMASVESEDHKQSLQQLNLNPGIYLVEITGNETVFFKHFQD